MRKGRTMADSSFDVVSKLDRQEVDNALNQAAKELATGSTSGHRHQDRLEGRRAIELTLSTEERVKAAVDVFKEKLIRRDITMKALTPATAGVRQDVQGHRHPQAGHQQRERQEDHQLIRDEGPKTVKTQIQGDEVRSPARSATTCRPSSRC